MIGLPATPSRVHQLVRRRLSAKQHIEELVDERTILRQWIVREYHRGNSLDQARLESKPDALDANGIKKPRITGGTCQGNHTTEGDAYYGWSLGSAPGDELGKILGQVAQAELSAKGETVGLAAKLISDDMVPVGEFVSQRLH